MAKSKKMYVVLSVSKNYLHGVFPLTDEGKVDALKYQRKLKRVKKIDTYISEK